MYPASLSREERPWLGLYPPGVAAEGEAEHQDGLSLFRAAVAERPDHPAVWYFGRTLTYAELDAGSGAVSGFLLEQGLRRGDRVAVGFQNGPEFILAILGTWKAGGVPLPVNPMYRRGELARIFADAEPAALVCEIGDLAEMRAGLAEAGLSPFATLAADPADFGLGFDFGRPAWSGADDAPRLADILRVYAGATPGVMAADAEDLGLLLYTSGTTGAPKGAMLRHRSLTSNARVLRDWCGLDRDARIWALAPYFHITGFVCHLMASFSARATLVSHYRFDARLALEVIRSARPTFTIGAITAFNALMNAPGAQAGDLASLTRIYSGGAPIPPALTDAFRARFGVAIHPSYGMTETAAPTHLTPFGAQAPVDPTSGALSIGIPIPATEAAIVDEDDRPLPPGEVGELVMRGPQIMSGYWRKAEETAAALKEGWMHSGDVGFRDEAGWFYLVDRKKDVIIASGFKVWPREVEDVLYAHPAVREAAVVGAPDVYRGETVKAYVSLAPGASAVAAELISYCRERLAAYKAPREIVLLDELPKTVTGKIQRAVLRDLAVAGPSAASE